MYKGKRVCLVIPAHDEERHIGTVVRSVPEFVDNVVVVDDGSTDRTSEIVRGSQDPRVELIRHESNQGVGAAVVTGYRRAIALGADVVGRLDGDGQMDPNYLRELLDAVLDDGFHYAKGNRFMTRRMLQEMPRGRVWGNAILTFLTKFASGYWQVFDPQNGYTATTREVLETIPLVRLRHDYVFENSVLCELYMGNFRVKDVPIPAVYRDEDSEIRVGRFSFAAAGYLFRRFWRRIFIKYMIRDFHPVALFYVFGTLLLLVGIFFGVVALALSLGPPIATTGTIMLAVVPFFLGFQLVLSAISVDISLTPR